MGHSPSWTGPGAADEEPVTSCEEIFEAENELPLQPT
jgi:hypothetical protein